MESYGFLDIANAFPQTGLQSYGRMARIYVQMDCMILENHCHKIR